MFMAAAAAGPVYRLLGKQDLGTTEFPPTETALVAGDLAYRQHAGGHTSGPNWPTFLDFAARHFSSSYQSHIVPSSRRAMGSCFGLYGYFAASFSSMLTPWPGVSPQMQAAVAEHVVVREHFVGFRRVPHVFLDAEVRHPGVEMQRRAHAHRRQIRGAVKARAHADAARRSPRCGAHA